MNRRIQDDRKKLVLDVCKCIQNDKFTFQHYFQCETCNITTKQEGNRTIKYGVCVVCTFRCHQGHSLKYAGYGGFVCDCNDFNRCKKPIGYIRNNSTYNQKTNALAIPLSNRKCTRETTKKHFTYQHYFTCRTCNYGQNAGACLECATTCHKGHDIVPNKYGPFYCDCPDKTSGCISKKNEKIFNLFGNFGSNPNNRVPTHEVNVNDDLKDENALLKKQLRCLELDLKEEKIKTGQLFEMNAKLSNMVFGGEINPKVEPKKKEVKKKEPDDNWDLVQLTDRKDENNLKIKKLQAENELIDNFMKEKTLDEKICSICMENPKSVVCIPCGHVFCGVCSEKFQQCPFDRKTIMSKTKIFY